MLSRNNGVHKHEQTAFSVISCTNYTSRYREIFSSQKIQGHGNYTSYCGNSGNSDKLFC